MAQYASDAVLINGPQYLKDNVTIAYVCISPAKADNLSTIQGKAIASVAVANADIAIADSGDNMTMTTNAKSGLDPSGTAPAGQDIAVVFCSASEVLGAIDATDRIITNEAGDTINIPAGLVTLNNWS
jgi:hypothetical protein